MRIRTKRLRKKFLKIVADCLSNGKEVPRFYFLKVEKHFDEFQLTRYVEEFRPMLDEIDADLNWQDLRVEHIKKVNAEYQKKYGVDTRLLCRYSYAMRQNEPKRARKARKKRPAPPVRKLRNPRMYKITTRNDPNYRVLGEPAFEYRDLRFFVHHFRGKWTVSEVESGLQVATDERYKRVIARAKQLVESNYDKIKRPARGQGA